VTIRINKYLDDIMLIDSIISVIKKLSERYAMNDLVIGDEYRKEMRNCLSWCVSNINYAINQSTGI
jgi:hypothetical protein